MPDASLKELTDDQLDRAYLKVAGGMLAQIGLISNAPNSAMQASLKKLDAEADRLNEADERMTVDNAQLQQTLNEYRDTTNTTQRIILANDETIEASGQALAVPAVTAKVFLAVSAALVAQGRNPITSLPALKEAVKSTPWIFPDASQFVLNYVVSDAWTAKMNGWGDGYADLTRDTLLQGIQSGWGSKFTASQMRQHAENIPVSASENLTRTLQNTAFRDASAAMEVINSEFVEGKIRVATLNGATCLNCVALHGTPLALGERVDDHYRGRCTEFYVVKGGPRTPAIMQSDSTPGNRQFVPYQTGPEWFDGLPASRQEQQVSFLNTPAKLRAFRDGTPLEAFVSSNVDPVFGQQTVENSLVGALGDNAEQYYNINQ